MTPKERDKLLQDLHVRIVRMETQLEDLPVMKEKLDRLMIRVAGTAAAVSAALALLSHLF